jgi:hypothetical protein
VKKGMVTYMQQRMEELINRLNSSQERAEKNSFDTLNQHDKVRSLITQLVMDLDCIVSKIEAMFYQIDDSVMTSDQAKDSLTTQIYQCCSEMIDEQNGMIIGVSQLLQRLMEEQQIECEVIHEMEAQIASNREIIEEVILLHNE